MELIVVVFVYLFVGFLLAALSKRKWNTGGAMLFCCMVASPAYFIVITWCLIAGDGKPQPFLYLKKVI